LLLPNRQPDVRRSNPHEGSTLAEVPNELWGTDATATFRKRRAKWSSSPVKRALGSPTAAVSNPSSRATRVLSCARQGSV